MVLENIKWYTCRRCKYFISGCDSINYVNWLNNCYDIWANCYWLGHWFINWFNDKNRTSQYRNMDVIWLYPILFACKLLTDYHVSVYLSSRIRSFLRWKMILSLSEKILKVKHCFYEHWAVLWYLSMTLTLTGPMMQLWMTSTL